MEKKWHYTGNSRGSHHRKATFRPEVRRVGKALDTTPGTTKRLLPLGTNSDIFPLSMLFLLSEKQCF